MNHRFVFLFVIIACVVLFPFRAPAPLTYTPGEGWYYESYGESTKWQRVRAKDQLEVAQQSLAEREMIAGELLEEMQREQLQQTSTETRLAALREDPDGLRFEERRRVFVYRVSGRGRFFLREF